jgi:hypothetical protein
VYIKFNKEESNPNFRFHWRAAELVQVEWEPVRVPIHRQLLFVCAVSVEKNMDQKSPPRPYPCPRLNHRRPICLHCRHHQREPLATFELAE